MQAILQEKLIPAADRIVVEQENFSHFLTAHTLIQQHQGVGAPRHATSRQTIARQRDQRLAILFTEKAASNHAAIRIQPCAKRKLFPELFNELGVYIPWGEPREIPEKSFVHELVVQRIQECSDYRPINMPRDYQVVPIEKIIHSQPEL